MTLTSRMRLLATSLPPIAIALALVACNRTEGHVNAASTNPPQQVQKPVATPERLVERSKARWDLIVRKDWIAAYDYLSPEQKKNLPLQDYLRGKDNHVYANPRMDTVLQIDGENGYLRGTVLWTPHHPMIKPDMVPAGKTLTEELQMIEIWRWADGDWTYVQAERDYEFLEKHPEFLKDTKATAPVSEPKGADLKLDKLEPEPKAAAR